MARWYFDPNSDEPRIRYHNFKPCLFVATLRGEYDDLTLTTTRSKWGDKKHSNSGTPVPLCRAGGLEIDAALDTIAQFYELQQFMEK